MFYSQLLSKPVIDNFCVKCETKFVRWTDYHQHVTETNCLKVIKPVRTTNRPTGIKRQGLELAKEGTIVGDWERKNERNII